MKNLSTQKLVPDQLKESWDALERKTLGEEAFNRKHKRLINTYRRIWRDALVLEGHRGLEESLLAELGEYIECEDLVEMRRRCEGAMAGIEEDWRQRVTPGDRKSIERFYEESQVTLYELMWWHTLIPDDSPLAYVTALHFAQQHDACNYLDFGAGVGSGALLFARHGLTVALADISTTMLDFCEWRFGYKRSLPVHVIDLKFTKLPREAFDIVTAMDVFEHLVDPVETVTQVWESMKPGGFLFGRFDNSPEGDLDEGQGSHQHIVENFEPMFHRMRELGLVEVWQDEWLWGHQAFQKLA